MHRRITSAALVVSIVFALGGCVNLEAVREFTKASSALTSYQQVATDDITLAEYYLLTAREKNKKKAQNLVDTSMRQAERFKVYLKAISEYMDMLSQLAGEGVVDLKEEQKALSTALASTVDDNDPGKDEKKKENEAAAQLAIFLGKLTIDFYRQNQLRFIISTYGPSVDVLIGTIQDALKSNEMNVLVVEAQVDRWANRAIKSLEDSKKSKPDLSPLRGLVVLHQREMLDEGLATAKRLDAFREALAKVKEGNLALVKNVDNFGAKELFVQLKDNASGIRNAYKQLKVVRK